MRPEGRAPIARERWGPGAGPITDSAQSGNGTSGRAAAADYASLIRPARFDKVVWRSGSYTPPPRWAIDLKPQ